jgi:filamentous hemagglutinin family protein
MPSSHRFQALNVTLNSDRRGRDTRTSIIGRQASWLAGVSLAALLFAATGAQARPLGGFSSMSAPSLASDAASAAAQQAAALAKQSQAAMTRAAQALQAMRAAQAAARAAAQGNGSNSLGAGLPAVTDGLSPGGLVVDPRVQAAWSASAATNLWINADQPTQTTANGQTTVTVNQTAPEAVLTWYQFNIGRNTTLAFNQQGNASWIALNRIDATGLPSQILGNIKADGTVLVINPNGIIFGGGSQVNVGTLIASTHDIASSAAASVFNQASTSVPASSNYVAQSATLGGATVSFFAPQNEDSANSYFAQNGLFVIPSGSDTHPSAAFAMGNQTLGSVGGGNVVVQAGAIINAGGASANNGGYVALIGPTVTNAGSITASNGQVILAAGTAVVLTQPSTSATGVDAAWAVTPALNGGNSPTITVSVNIDTVANTGTVTNTDTVTFLNVTLPSSLTTGPTALPFGGLVTNNGLITSNDGAVALAGDTIHQLGGILATTSTTRTGSIKLDTTAAQPKPNGAIGNIALGPDSVTTILPDEASGTLPTATVNSTTTANGANNAQYFQTVLQPKITITAQGDVDVQGHGVGQGGALIKAPSAALTISADLALGTVLLEPGSAIDLSGIAGVTLPMSVNQVSILVTQAEVADNPLAAALIGQTVTIDARVGSPILNTSGYIGLIPQSIDQILTAGGSFTTSAKNVIQQPGAGINISAGYVQYLGGMISTSRVLGADGRAYDIGHADPNVLYTGLLSGFTVAHARWSTKTSDVTEIFAGPFGGAHFEPGYIAGVSAGSISVTATTPIISTDDITADVVVGTRQRALAGSSNLATSDQMPVGGSLSISFTNSAYNVILAPRADAGSDPYGLGGFTFANSATWTPVLAGGLFPIFSDGLSNAALSTISIKGAKQLSMPADAALTVQPGGSITLDGVSTIDGVLSAPGGKISLTGFTYGDDKPQIPPTPALVIGPQAVLDVHGLWVNDTGLSADQLQGPGFLNGGSVSISTLAASNTPISGKNFFVDATQSIVLSPGSVIDVSGGGYVGTTGKVKLGSDGLPMGKGGSVALTTYAGGFTGHPASSSAGTSADFNVAPQDPDGTTFHPAQQANVLLDGTIHAQGFDGGGTFSLEVPSVVIDGGATQITSYISSAGINDPGGAALAGFAVSDAKAGTLVLPASFFTSGFSQISLSDNGVGHGFGGITVTAGTQVAPRQTNALLTRDAMRAPTGSLVRDFAPVGLLPDGLRKAANLSLAGVAVLLDRGATMAADPQATVTVAGKATILGSITAQAGNIVVDGQADTVTVGSSAVLDVSGVFVPNPQVVGRSSGTVLDGGTITLSGTSVEVQPDAQFDLQGASVSAASNLIQLPTQHVGQGPFLAGQAAWSNGGTLQLAGTNIYFAGSVDAAGGAPLATGGTLIVGSNLLANTVSNQLPTPGVIVIEQAGVIAASLPATGMPSQTGAFIGADTLSNSGFDSVTLNAGQTIAFNGSVNVTVPGALTLRADGGNFVLLPASTGLLPPGVTDPAKFVPASCGATCIPSTGGAVVNLNAGYVRIVGTPSNPFAFPNLADGTLNVSAQWIDLQRAIALDNFANANFTSTGAIRLLPDNYGFGKASSLSSLNVAGRYAGALVAPGNLTLAAAEIYPVSNTDFMLMSTGTLASASTITIRQNGTATAPLSAGGTIALSGQTIVQGGTLWAPLGSIVVGMQSADQIPASVDEMLMGKDAQTKLPELYTGPFTKTQTVVLGAGSRTSVSTAGLDIPDGTTVDDTTWYLGTPPNSNGAAATGPAVNGFTVLAAPPAKSITLSGTDVTTASGAVLDLSGGGDVYATEFVAGNGGTRNALTTYQQNPSNTSAPISTYSDGRQVYALVPSYEAKVAAYDPNFAGSPYLSGQVLTTTNDKSTPLMASNATAPGQTVTIGPGSSIAAGTYVLLPGMYATLPGAYRVVQTASNVNPSARSSTGADGSQYVVGRLGNGLSGAQSSQTAIFQLQSHAVWSKYSRIDITSGTTFFRNQAIAAGVAPPPLPIDGGVLTLGATNTLNLLGTNLFAPGTSDLAPGLVGAGGQVQISATNILILAADQAVPSGSCVGGSGCFLELDADQLSALGASTVLIGGTATVASDGTEVITASALNLEVKTDAAHALTGPELVLVSLAPTSASAGAGGLIVDDGSVIRAKGAVPNGTDRDIVIGALPVLQSDGKTYKGQASGDGALLRVSNGRLVNVSRTYLPGQYAGPGPAPASSVPLGSFSIGNATIDGGNALTLDTSGNGSLDSRAILDAKNYDIAGSVINIGGGSSGLVLSTATLQSFAGADSVQLRSASVINLYDANGLAINVPVGTLTFDSAGLYSQGGITTVNAANIDLSNSRGATGTGNTGAGGTLNLNASGTIIEDVGAKSLAGFSEVNFNAGQSIAMSGAGSVDSGPVATAALNFNVAMTSFGSGYTSVPTVTISGATATAILGVSQVTVAAGGTGYKNGDVVTVGGPNAGGSTSTATGIASVNASGAITSVTITSKGSGFTGAITSVTVASTTGKGASLTASLGVVSVSGVTAGGGDISTLTFSGGGGSGALAQAKATVTGFTLTPGDGYTGASAPSVTFNGGDGPSGTGTATVKAGAVTALDLNNLINGTYTKLPTVVISGGGGGSANIHLSAPAVTVNRGASQTLATLGNVTVAPGLGAVPAPVAGNIGGSLAIAAASIIDSGLISARSGNVSLTATTGDVKLNGNALIDVSGSYVFVLDIISDAPGGSVRLVSDAGNVSIGANAGVSVAAIGNGLAGSLSILAANNATLSGSLDGHAAFNDLGGNFALVANSLSGALPLSGFTSSFAVQLGSGDIAINAGQTLTSGKVLLVASNGSVTVNGTIDASGPNGGTIGLYGATGVHVGGNARLLARYQADDSTDPAYANGASTLVETGGTITLGTTGTPDGTLNQTYGYQNVSNSGKITVDAGAVFDVSGGAGGPNINNAGGTVYVRAPILTNNNINVSFAGTLVTNAVNGSPSGGGVVASAYAVWSTTDGCSLIPAGCNSITTAAQYNALSAAQKAQMDQHFDGIIDPAGFFDASGTQLIFANNGLYPISTFSTPASGAYLAHVDFYQNTLLNFVQNPFNDSSGSTAHTDAVKGDFAGAKLRLSGATTSSALSASGMLHLRPEIDLINPTSSINGGNITVASNWNLGAGNEDVAGNITLTYRTTNGKEPGVLALLAANNVNIDATITDGFFTSYAPGGATNALTQYTNETSSALYQSYLGMFSPAGSQTGTLQYDSSGVQRALTQLGTSWSLLGLSQPPTSAGPSAGFFGFTDDTSQLRNGSIQDYKNLNLTFQLATPILPDVSQITDPTVASKVTDQYNQYYAEYVTLFRAYETELLAGTLASTDGKTNQTKYNLTATGTGTAIVTGGNVLSYADFFLLAQSKQGRKTISPFQNANITIPAAPGAGTSYFDLTNGLGAIKPITTTNGNGFYSASPTAAETALDYATEYTVYFYNVLNLEIEDFRGATLAQAINSVEKGMFAPTLVLPAGATNAAGPGAPGYVPGIDFALGVKATIAITPPAPPPAYGILQPGSKQSALNPVHPADLVANNPAFYNVGSGSNVYNTTSASQLMTAAVSGQGSFSYDIVAGAAFTATGALPVDPNAVIPTSSLSGTVTGNVSIAGHTSYPDVLPASAGGSSSSGLTINIPTLVRTGTGSITIAAAGDVRFVDQTTPGAVYTAGAAAATPSDFNAPILAGGYTVNPNGLVSAPAWGTGGGAVTVTASGSIIGVEMPIDANGSQSGTANQPIGQLWSDWYFHYGKSSGKLTPFSNCAGAGSIACQTASWVNYATFFQGFGALGGGNINLTAGANIRDIGASLPETLVVGGGFTSADPPKATYYGGGDLRVTAGGDVLSSDFLVGRGTGFIQAGGAVKSDVSFASSGSTSAPVALPLLLAVQDGFVSVAANGPVTLGNVYDPAAVATNAEMRTNIADLPGGAGIFGNLFTSFGPSSGVSLSSVSGDVTALTVPAGNSDTFLFRHLPLGQGSAPRFIGQLLPATLDVTALSGNVFVISNTTTGGFGNANLVPYPTQTGSDTGTFDIVAAGSIDLGQGLSMPDLNTKTTQYIGNSSNVLDYGNYISPLGVPLANVTEALHANDPAPVIIAAGKDIIAAHANGIATTMSLIKPAEIEAGHNIDAAISAGGIATPSSGPQTVGFVFTGQNNNPTDITSIVAGNDFVGGSYNLGGPGTFLVQAGRNLGPFTTGGQGFQTVGNNNAVYLPPQGAELDVLFGVKPGIDYAGAIAAYGDPSAPNGTGFTSGAVTQLQVFANQLIDQQELRIISTGLRSLTRGNPATTFQGRTADQINPVLANLAAAAGFIDPHTHKPLVFNVTQDDIQSLQQPQSEAQLDQQVFSLFLARASVAGITNTVTLSPGDAVALYNSMSSLQINQELDTLAPRAGLTNLSFGLGVQDLTSLHLDQKRVQVTIGREFTDFLIQVGKDAKDPTSQFSGQYGRAYAAISTLFPASLGYTDNGTGSGNGAAATVLTGKFNIAASVLETQMGGDINIIGPGGGITVGHASLDTLGPSQEGILTLGGGTIRAFSDGSILLNQSRIMTEQGGDVDLLTANGDINAGSGPKTYVSSPAVSEQCTPSGFCQTSPQGLVTGAGIAALVTLPGQDPTKSNANLFAPHGTIDAGSAGIRVAGNTVLGALQILNAYNIQTQGTVTGLSTVQGPPVASLTTANNVVGSTVRTDAPTQNTASDKPSIIIVEVLGFGGGSGETQKSGDDQSVGGGSGETKNTGDDQSKSKRRSNEP